MNRFLAMALAIFATPVFLFAQTTVTNPTSDDFGQDAQVQNVCVDLRYNLVFRARDARTNGEVSDLQDFLISNGYLSGEPTGYFGAATLAAVRKFQSATGIGMPTTPGYGAIGPKSRARIKAMTCGGSAAVAPESSLPATTLAPSPTPAVQTPPTIPVTTTIALPTVITPLPFGCTPNTFYNPMTGAPCTPIAVVLPNGGEKLLKGTTIEILWAQPSSTDTEIRLLGYLSPACENPTATCDGNRTPAIYSIAKNPPIVIDKQRVYKWVVGETRDINIGGATNNYVVPDGLYKIQVCFWTNVTKGCDSSDNYFSITSPQTTTTATIAVPQPIIVPTTSLPDLTIVGMRSDRAPSTAFANIDTINFTVDVKNNGGDVATPFTVAVKVSGDAQYGAGGYFASNVIQGIRSGETKNVLIGSYLMPRGKELLGTITLIADYLGNVAESNEANNSIQKYLNIPALPTVISATPTSTTPSIPSIAITSPNGGEVLTVGQTKRITWKSSSVIDKVYIGYSFGTGSLNWIATNIPNTGYYDWNVNIGNTTNTQVKISITGYQTGTGSWSDQSDSFFTVNPAVSTITPTVILTSSPSSIDKRISTSETIAIGLIASIEGPILSAQQYSAFTWELIGNAPAGVTLSVEGAFYAVLRGTPTQTGNYVFAIRLRNPGAPGVYTDIPVTLNVFSPVATTTPTITLISPLQVTVGTTTQVQLDGSNFTPSLNIAIIGPGADTSVFPTAVSQDGKKLTFNFPSTITTTGNYSVQVYSLGGTGSNFLNLNLVAAVTQPSLSPTVTFTASPASITSGQTSILSWSSTNATSCASSGDGASWGWPSSRYITGAQYTPALTTTQTYTMSCTGAGGTTSKSVTVTIVPVSTTTIPAPQITSLTTINATQADTLNKIITWQVASGYYPATYKIKIDNLAPQDIGNTTSWGFNVKAGLPTSLSTVGTHTFNVQACSLSACGEWSNTVTVNVTASVVAPTLTTMAPTAQNVSPNSAGVKIGSFAVASGGNNIVVKTANVTIGLNGYPMTNLSNLVVKSGGVMLGTPIGNPGLTNPQVFSFAPVTILANQTKTFDVYADIGGASSGFVSTIMGVVYIDSVSLIEGQLSANAGVITTTFSSGALILNPSNQTQTASVIGALSGLSTTPDVSLWKYTWARNLEVGSPYSDDITALQTALIKEGVYTGEVTGGFYSQTYLAVKAFQSKYGIESTGFVGPATREKLNSIYGN